MNDVPATSLLLFLTLGTWGLLLLIAVGVWRRGGTTVHNEFNNATTETVGACDDEDESDAADEDDGTDGRWRDSLKEGD